MLPESKYQGDFLLQLMQQVERVLVEDDCMEVVRGHGADVEICRTNTSIFCHGENCEQPICEKHSNFCETCQRRFCWSCWPSHLCVAKSPSAEDLDRVAEEVRVREETC